MNCFHPLFRDELRTLATQELDYLALDQKTVAITGAGGLIGSYLVYALDEIRKSCRLKLTLIALCRSPEKTRARFADIEQLECLPYDAAQPLKLDFRADYLLHAASNAHPLAFSSDPVGTMQANLLGSMNLLEHARRSGGRFLLFSTGEIYGENPALTDGFSETDFGVIDPMNFRACYPESKRAAETLCACYARQYGVDALAARLTYVYGPTITDRNSRADAQFLRRALNHEDIVLKSVGTQVRSYTYVADAVSALLTLMLRGEAATAYNIANPDSAVSIRQYAETLAELAGVRVVFDLPPESERAGYSTVSRAVLNPARLTVLGWHADYDLHTGLAHTLRICADGE